MLAAEQKAWVLGFSDYSDTAQRFAVAAGMDYAEVEVHRFPDGESRIRLPLPLAERLVFCRTLDHPNEKLLELELAAATAREHGVRDLTLVAPYLGYMRQDKEFHPGEAISQKIVGRLLARCFDRMITVDPHLHRVHRLEQAVPVQQAICLSAAQPMSDFLARREGSPMLLGPDEESGQWVSSIAQDRNLDYAVASKQRFGDHEVRVHLPQRDFRGRDIVLVDDVVSTGRTLEEAARQLQSYRPRSLSVLVTHALFVDDAEKRIRSAGVQHIFSTDSIPHATNCVYLAELLAAGLRGAGNLV